MNNSLYIRLLFVAACTLALHGCGQAGPLYLPPPPPGEAPPAAPEDGTLPPADEPAPAELQIEGTDD